MCGFKTSRVYLAATKPECVNTSMGSSGLVKDAGKQMSGGVTLSTTGWRSRYRSKNINPTNSVEDTRLQSTSLRLGVVMLCPGHLSKCSLCSISLEMCFVPKETRHSQRPGTHGPGGTAVL